MLLEFEACGDSDVGRCAPVGAGLPWGVGEGLCEELLRFEPTRFLKRAFMELMREGGRRAGQAGGVRCRISGSGAAADSKLGAVQTAQAARLCEGKPANAVRRSPGIGWGSWRIGKVSSSLTRQMQRAHTQQFTYLATALAGEIDAAG